MRNEYVDMMEVQRRLDLEVYDKEEYALALSWVRQHCPEGEDPNPAAQQLSAEEKDNVWQTVVKMTLICRDLMVGNERLSALGFEEEALGHNAILAGFQGQRHWTDHRPNGDFMEAVLNSSFDWNGTRHPHLMATENDALNGVSMLFGNLLTGQAQIFADVRTYWSPDSVERVTGFRPDCGFIHLVNSGSAALDGTGQHTDENGQPVIKPHWQITEEDTQNCLEATRWPAAVTEYFRGSGFSSQFLTKGAMPFTLTRVNLVKGLGPVLQIAEGWSLDLPEEVHDILNKRTNETWPTTWFVPRLTGEGAFSDVYSVMANWGANHGVLTYGHVGADFIALASMLRIPVCMHNVAEQDIFRPSSWNAFGMDKEGQDYRACQSLGPLYR
jgi:L-fucose isomerase